MPYSLSVAVLTPAHSGMAVRPDAVHLSGLLSYSSIHRYPNGTLVRVPLGKRETLGIVWGQNEPFQPVIREVPAAKLREISAAFDSVPPLSTGWLNLLEFAAAYYHRSIGEVALAALPPSLRSLTLEQWARKLRRKSKQIAQPSTAAPQLPNLTEEQNSTLADIQAKPGPFLLFGVTGSGKTEVYLQAVHQVLQSDPLAQALVMVPEINLTPQLESRFIERFAPVYGPHAVVALHSGLTPAQRLVNWLAAHRGAEGLGARVILGTRMAIFASMPGLKLIVVDEEHDPSYKSQDGARYSARDLAVYRGRLEGAKVILGSATPSLESWRHSSPPSVHLQSSKIGRYHRLDMPSRVGSGNLPRVKLVDMAQQPPKTLFSPALVAAMTQRIARGEQCMILLNRRGYAPVLSCGACNWKSECANCSAHRVFHKIDRTLRCHHCGFTERVPRACPECGNVDITPVGRGTEQIEEQLIQLFESVRRPDGAPACVLRIDADSTRQKGELGKQLSQVHAGEVDILVGTQMIAKGHDFRRVTLVAAINPDGALFSADFRAPERMFALMMQAAGRAGRAADKSAASEMWIQTSFPKHPLFKALERHDFPAFAAKELEAREQAGMPPFSFQALVRADALTQEAAQSYLQAVSDAAQGVAHADKVTRYPCVPLTIQRVANVERAQMLVESPSRPSLQAFLSAWHPILHALKALPVHRGILRWAIDVDPLLI
jgi:primosomal protein N' (replication factor Y)